MSGLTRGQMHLLMGRGYRLCIPLDPEVENARMVFGGVARTLSSRVQEILRERNPSYEVTADAARAFVRIHSRALVVQPKHRVGIRLGWEQCVDLPGDTHAIYCLIE